MNDAALNSDKQDIMVAEMLHMRRNDLENANNRCADRPMNAIRGRERASASGPSNR
jgi:hypothetical protein